MNHVPRTSGEARGPWRERQEPRVPRRPTWPQEPARATLDATHPNPNPGTRSADASGLGGGAFLHPDPLPAALPTSSETTMAEGKGWSKGDGPMAFRVQTINCTGL